MSLKLKTSYIIKSFILKYYTINSYSIRNHLLTFLNYYYFNWYTQDDDTLSFDFIFYHLLTFILIQERHIFYTINRNNLKKWITINDSNNDGKSSKQVFISNDLDKIGEIFYKQLILNNEIQKLNEKFENLDIKVNRILELLKKK